VPAGWKAFETRMARLFGMERRGADFRNHDGLGNDDCREREGCAPSAWSLEMTLQAKLGYSDLLAKCRQAEDNARVGKTPIVIAKLKRIADDDALVVMRLRTFRKQFDLAATLTEQN
jgi:hypothetical protein